MLVVLFAGCFSFVCFAGCVSAGIAVLVNARPRRRWLGGILCALALVVPVGVYLAPDIMFRIQHGRDPLTRYPSGVIDKGMTKEQVRAKLGEPHSTFAGGHQESWYYYTDALGVGYFGVTFDENGRVDFTGGD
jgi:hypothetical protein